jgi:mono/diheme cytochrome c family protein
MPGRLTIVRTAIVAGWVIALGTLAACGDWPWRHDMVDQPSRAIASESRAPAGEAMPIGSELPMARELAETQLRSPVPLDAPITSGRALFETYCTPCHGFTGGGDGTVSQYFGSMPDLMDRDVQQHADGWFYATITNGTERMPRYVQELTPDERWQIVHFLRVAGATR